MHIELIDESMTNNLGEALAKSCPKAPFLATLRGNLGVGKSHLVRAFLKKLGVTDPIPSPTYTLCETCLLYTSPSPRDGLLSRMPSSA